MNFSNPKTRKPETSIPEPVRVVSDEPDWTRTRNLHRKQTRTRKILDPIMHYRLPSDYPYFIFYLFIFFCRDLTLHQNRWHCDCHLLNLRNWLQNFTVPNSIEPKCHTPPRLISESIKGLVPNEFACIPKVSPTSMYLEVIEGKNMSLVCTIEVSWIWKYLFTISLLIFYEFKAFIQCSKGFLMNL